MYKPRIRWIPKWSSWAYGPNPSNEVFVFVRQLNQLNWKFRSEMVRKAAEDFRHGK